MLLLVTVCMNVAVCLTSSMPKKKPAPEIKILVVGAKSVGKYSLGHQFAKGWISPRTNGKSVCVKYSLLKTVI